MNIGEPGTARYHTDVSYRDLLDAADEFVESGEMNEARFTVQMAASLIGTRGLHLHGRRLEQYDRLLRLTKLPPYHEDASQS